MSCPFSRYESGRKLATCAANSISDAGDHWGERLRAGSDGWESGRGQEADRWPRPRGDGNPVWADAARAYGQHLQSLVQAWNTFLLRPNVGPLVLFQSSHPQLSPVHDLYSFGSTTSSLKLRFGVGQQARVGDELGAIGRWGSKEQRGERQRYFLFHTLFV